EASYSAEIGCVSGVGMFRRHHRLVESLSGSLERSSRVPSLADGAECPPQRLSAGSTTHRSSDVLLNVESIERVSVVLAVAPRQAATDRRCGSDGCDPARQPQARRRIMRPTSRL